MDWIYDDGGRAAAGFKGDAGDCVVRSISIATGMPYPLAYEILTQAKKTEKLRRGVSPKGTARDGVPIKAVRRYLKQLGWTWVATSGIGLGCIVHLRAEELPAGRIICQVSKHLVAVIDGIIHDTYDPSRGGTRCVYGYWMEPK